MIFQLVAIARNCLVESLRQPIVLLIVLLCGVAQLFLTMGINFSMGTSAESGEVNYDTKLLFDVGLGTVFVCGVALAAFVATAVISSEIERRTVLTVVSKPIPRPVVVLGKYLGVAGALLVGLVPMIVFLLMGVRHGVMSTAADTLDWVVLAFSVGGVLACLGAAAAGNYLYGWSFPQTAVTALAPVMALGYVVTLSLSKDWAWQPLSKDFKPQIMIACAGMTMAILMLSSVAVAASTRLGQVMTIVVTAGVFMGGLLTNAFLGSKAWNNTNFGRIKQVESPHASQAAFARPGDEVTFELESAPNATLLPGTAVWWGPIPSGLSLKVGAYQPYEGDFMRERDQFRPDLPPALVVTSVQEKRVTLRQVGRGAVAVSRPPAAGDYVFLEPTRYSLVHAALWAVVPNLHFYWLLDAVTQNAIVPLGHLGLIAVYGVLHIGCMLGLAVALFQRRDVG